MPTDDAFYEILTTELLSIDTSQSCNENIASKCLNAKHRDIILQTKNYDIFQKYIFMRFKRIFSKYTLFLFFSKILSDHTEIFGNLNDKRK